MVELPLGCSFTHNFINFVNEKGYIDSQPLLLPRITIPQTEVQQQDTLEIKLTKIPLDKLVQIKNNQHKLEIKHNFTEHLNTYYSTVPLVIILTIAILLLHKYLQRYNHCKNVKVKKEECENPWNPKEVVKGHLK